MPKKLPKRPGGATDFRNDHHGNGATPGELVDGFCS